MRLTVGLIAASIVMAAVLVSYWPGGPAQLSQNEAQAQQGEKVKETPAPNPEKVEANAQTRAKLEKLVPAEFEDTPLSQVLDYLANNVDVQFHMDKKVLSEAGVSSDTPITFHLKNIPAEMVLRWILRDIGDLTYYLDTGVIIVTTSDEANCRLETQVYRIDDLICYPTVAKNKETSDIAVKKPNKVDYDSLVNLVIGTIRPVTWDSVGGPGSISPYRGTLVISQTAEVHQEIQKLLKDLRQSINPDIDTDDESSPKEGGGMGWGRMIGGTLGERVGSKGGGIGGTGVMESSNKEPEKKDEAQPSSEKEKKVPKESRGGKGPF